MSKKPAATLCMYPASPEINPQIIFGQLIFDKTAKTILWGKDHLFNKCC